MMIQAAMVLGMWIYTAAVVHAGERTSMEIKVVSLILTTTASFLLCLANR